MAGCTLRPPKLLMQDGLNRLQNLEHRLQSVMQQTIVKPRAEHLQSIAQILSSLAPQNTLKRGYAIVSGGKIGIVDSKAKALDAGKLALQFHDGVVGAEVID